MLDRATGSGESKLRFQKYEMTFLYPILRAATCLKVPAKRYLLRGYLFKRMPVKKIPVKSYLLKDTC